MNIITLYRNCAVGPISRIAPISRSVFVRDVFIELLVARTHASLTFNEQSSSGVRIFGMVFTIDDEMGFTNGSLVVYYILTEYPFIRV